MVKKLTFFIKLLGYMVILPKTLGLYKYMNLSEYGGKHFQDFFAKIFQLGCLPLILKTFYTMDYIRILFIQMLETLCLSLMILCGIGHQKYYKHLKNVQ